MIMMQSTILTEYTDENFFKLKKILLEKIVLLLFLLSEDVFLLIYDPSMNEQ
jgi:hypothetical protein